MFFPQTWNVPYQCHLKCHKASPCETPKDITMPHEMSKGIIVLSDFLLVYFASNPPNRLENKTLLKTVLQEVNRQIDWKKKKVLKTVL